MSEAKKRGLGRGLSALLGEEDEEVAVAASGDSAEAAHPGPGGTTQHIAITDLKPSPFQPRSNFDDDAIDDLAASIREKGIIQPILVRASSTGETTYEIIAGERRWRAAQRAQLHEVPVLVREFSDTEVLEVAIIENVQRSDLNAVEEAAGYRQLMDRFGHTQEKIAEALGKSRSHIANLLRLLSLPQDVQDLLQGGDLSAGHARALIPAENPSDLARKVVKGGLSVRATEALVKKSLDGKNDNKRSKASRSATEKDADTRALEGDLAANLGMRVSLDHSPDSEKGKITIEYDTLDQLDSLCRMLSGE